MSTPARSRKAQSSFQKMKGSCVPGVFSKAGSSASGTW